MIDIKQYTLQVKLRVLTTEERVILGDLSSVFKVQNHPLALDFSFLASLHQVTVVLDSSRALVKDRTSALFLHLISQLLQKCLFHHTSISKGCVTHHNLVTHSEQSF